MSGERGVHPHLDLLLMARRRRAAAEGVLRIAHAEMNAAETALYAASEAVFDWRAHAAELEAGK